MNDNELNLSFNFKIEGFNYMVYASSENMKFLVVVQKDTYFDHAQKRIGIDRW